MDLPLSIPEHSTSTLDIHVFVHLKKIYLVI